ncbi:MAG: amidohydrolase [Archangium sp.]|nr:amidohydrolase [Archangium sp.]
MKRVAPGPDSTIVFVAKKIRTQNFQKPFAQAIAWKHGKILASGTEREVLAVAGGDAIVERFPDAVIIPGLVDAHAHVESLGRSLSTVSLFEATSEADAVERVQAAPKTAFQGEWLIGRAWDQNDWPGQQFPSRATLDAVFPKTPVWLTRVDGHAAWVNSAALERAGITAKTPDPEGGQIIRDAKGEPTGVLIDNAMDVVGAKIPLPSDEELQRRLKLALETCARLGLTQVHDAGMDMRTFRQLQTWDMVGSLPVRLYVMADGQGAEADAWLGLGTFSGRLLEMKAVKLYVDGALGSRGALLHAPYSDEPARSGLALISTVAFEAKAKAFNERGFQVAVHAIGDKANTIALDVLSGLDRKLRHRIEHAQILRAEDVERFAKSGIIASFQPTHATSDMPWAEKRVGAERIKFAYAWRSLLDSGAHVAFGSDFPVEDPDPRLGLYAARTREDLKGQPPGGWKPEQKLTGEEALAGFTSGAAYAAFAEDRRGQLREGFDADFVVLSADPVEVDPKEVPNLKVLITVVNGVDVFRAP